MGSRDPSPVGSRDPSPVGSRELSPTNSREKKRVVRGRKERGEKQKKTVTVQSQSWSEIPDVGQQHGDKIERSESEESVEARRVMNASTAWKASTMSRLELERNSKFEPRRR